MPDNERADSVHWLQSAHDDLTAARILRQSTHAPLTIVCFHAQQCAEKALKAVLIVHEVTFPRTHILERLLDLLLAEDVTVPSHINESFILTQYAVETRYPGVSEPITLPEAESALKIATEVLLWAQMQCTAP